MLINLQLISVFILNFFWDFLILNVLYYQLKAQQ